MGLGCSQARLLSLTTRLSDLELQANVYSNAKMALSESSSVASKNYTDSLNTKKITIYNGNTNSYTAATGSVMTTYNRQCNQNKELKNAYGYVIVSSATEKAFKAAQGGSTTPEIEFAKALGYTSTDAERTTNSVIDNTKSTDSDGVAYYKNLYDEMLSGYSVESDENLGSKDWLYASLENGCVYVNKTTSDGTYDRIDFKTGDTELAVEDDDSNTVKAKAEYQETLDEIEVKENYYDTKITDLQTEHSALENEKESLQKVIDSNIGRSFKLFQSS